MDNLDNLIESSTSLKSNAATHPGTPGCDLRTAADYTAGRGAAKAKNRTRTGRHLTSRLRDITRMTCKSLLCSALHYRTLRVAERNRSLVQSGRRLFHSPSHGTAATAWAQRTAAEIRANFDARRTLRRRAENEMRVKVKPVVQVLRGETGVGKTSAACRFIHSTASGTSDGGQSGLYASIFWVHGSSQSSLTRSWRELAIALDILPAASLSPLTVFSRPLRNHLATTRSRWLLVIADVKCLSLLMCCLEENLPVTGCCCDVLVLTSDMTGSLCLPTGDFLLTKGTSMQRWTHAEASDVIKQCLPMLQSTSSSHSLRRSVGAADSGATWHRTLTDDIALVTQGNPRCVSIMCQCVAKAASLGINVASQIRRCAASLETPAAKSGSDASQANTAPSPGDLVPSPFLAVSGMALHCCLSPAAVDLLCIAAAMGGEQFPLALVLFLPATLLPGDLRRALGTTWSDVLCNWSEDDGGNGGQDGSRTLRQCSKTLLRLVRELQVLELAMADCGGGGWEEEVEATTLSVSPAVRDAVLCCLPSASAGAGPGSLSCVLEGASSMLLEADLTCCWPVRRALLLLQNEMLVPRLACRLARSPQSSGSLRALSSTAKYSLCTLLQTCFYLRTPEDSTADHTQLICLLETLELVQLDESSAAHRVRAALERCCNKVLSRQGEFERTLHAHQVVAQIPRKVAHLCYPMLLQYGAKYLTGRYRRRAGPLAGLQCKPGNMAEALCMDRTFPVKLLLCDLEDLIGSKHVHHLTKLTLDVSAGIYLMLELLEKRISAQRNSRMPRLSRQLADFHACFDPLCHNAMDAISSACQGSSNGAHTATPVSKKAFGGLTEDSMSRTSSSPKANRRQRHHPVRRSGSIGEKLAWCSYRSLLCTGVTRLSLVPACLIILRALALLVEGRHTDFHREVERARCVKQYSCQSPSLLMDVSLLLFAMLEMSCAHGRSSPSVVACDMLD